MVLFENPALLVVLLLSSSSLPVFLLQLSPFPCYSIYLSMVSCTSFYSIKFSAISSHQTIAEDVRKEYGVKGISCLFQLWLLLLCFPFFCPSILNQECKREEKLYLFQHMHQYLFPKALYMMIHLMIAKSWVLLTTAEKDSYQICLLFSLHLWFSIKIAMKLCLELNIKWRLQSNVPVFIVTMSLE